MNQQNHYEVLELTPSATPAEIKSAYRRLALKYHPDRNSGSKEAADSFRKVKAAYDVLNDENKRAVYDDNFRFQSNKYENFGFGNEASERAERYRAGGYIQGKNDVRITEEFTLEEVALGAKSRFLQYQKKQRCDVCHGVNYSKCDNCSKTGLITVPKTVIADFPPGANPSYTFTMQELGNDSLDSKIPGDLVIQVKLKKHSVYKIQEQFMGQRLNLNYQLNINLIDLLLSNEFEIPTIYGDTEKITVNLVDAITEEFIKIDDKGLPKFNDIETKGDLYVHLNVKLPDVSKLSGKKKKTLGKLIEAIKKVYDKNSN